MLRNSAVVLDGGVDGQVRHNHQSAIKLTHLQPLLIPEIAEDDVLQLSGATFVLVVEKEVQM